MINGEEYISENSRSQRSTAVAAKWLNVIGIDQLGEAPIRIGRIISFVKHTIKISPDSTETKYCTAVLGRLEWYGDHPRRHFLHSSVLACSTVFEPESCVSFMPVSRIMCRCAVSIPLSLTFDYGAFHLLSTVSYHINCALCYTLTFLKPSPVPLNVCMKVIIMIHSHNFITGRYIYIIINYYYSKAYIWYSDIRPRGKLWFTQYIVHS